MIAAINSRADLEAIKGTPDYDRFLEFLAGTVNRYEWDGSQWVLVEDTSALDRFGVSVEEIGTAPVPSEPTFNPDEQALEQEAKQARAQRDRMLTESDFAVLPDAPVSDAQAWKDYRQALRDLPEQAGFPEEITWPTKP